jgi:hypothetical protein
MFSEVRSRILSLRNAVSSAKKVSSEMVAQHGETVWQRLSDLEASAWSKGAYTEFVYWKLVREYARDATKSAALNRRGPREK